MTTVDQHIATDSFEEVYLRLRHKEGRVYSDEQVANLPEITKTDSHYDEWRMRQISSRRLLKYLLDKKNPMDILEVGCGNGWLSARLSVIPSVHITGIDVNIEELNQAKRVFSKTKNLSFCACDLRDELLKNRHFDMIVFAASIQYFSSLPAILNQALSHLKQGGEIHIIDSPFYKQNDLAAAKQRSQAYYESMNASEMADHYFHHCLDELKSFKYKIISNPFSASRHFRKNKNPFYWISIQQQ